MGWIQALRDARWLRRHRIPEPLWLRSTREVRALARLDAVEKGRLRALASLLLRDKAITGVAGLEIDEAMAVCIAAQACLPILNLSLDWYDDWFEVVVYPETFVVEHEEVDEAGVVHRRRRSLIGEAWGRGPLVLSWVDIRHPHPGGNVVIHECAHKLDMRNGVANGFPPLHRGMSREQWTRTFSEAFEGMRHRLAHHHRTPIDPYGAESPAEFFAVLSEAFFEMPRVLVRECAPVYGQLRLFYRQDPAQGPDHPGPVAPGPRSGSADSSGGL